MPLLKQTAGVQALIDAETTVYIMMTASHAESPFEMQNTA
jgi:hypothetical protein